MCIRDRGQCQPHLKACSVPAQRAATRGCASKVRPSKGGRSQSRARRAQEARIAAGGSRRLN
eukprot:10150839-Alexandrium_andersonii.AAC.1